MPLQERNQLRIMSTSLLSGIIHQAVNSDGSFPQQHRPISFDSNTAPAPLPSPSQENALSVCTKHEIRIWPQIILSASQQKLGGAIRVWSIARVIDAAGSGVVEKTTLLSALKTLEVPSASRYRWLQAAKNSKLLRPVRGGKQLLITGIQKTGRLLNCPDIGPRCLIRPQYLLRKHWKSRVWDLLLTQFKNRPVSRATLFQITGIPVRTQLELERFGQVKAHHNWCMTNIDISLITPYAEFSRPHAFVAQINQHSHIVYQMPNHYTVPRLSGTPDGGSYRRKTYTAASASVKSDNPECLFSVVRCSESNFRAGGARCGIKTRIYFDREKPFSRALRRLGRNNVEGTLYRRISVPRSKTKNGWYFEEQIQVY